MTEQEFIVGWLSVKVNFSLDYPQETVEFWQSQLLSLPFKDYQEAIQRINGEKWYKTDSLYERVIRAMGDIQKERRDNYREPEYQLPELPEHRDPKVTAMIMKLVKKFSAAMKRDDKAGMESANKELKEFERS